MAVSSETTGIISYTGDGSTTAFPVPFLFSVASDLLVVETVIATGVETTKTLTTHYTVSGGGGNPGAPATGTVTAVTAPASTVRWTIKRNLPLLQALTLVNNTAFPPTSIMYALDRLTLMIQDQEENFTRALSSTIGSSVSDVSISTPVANALLQYNDDGTVIGSISLTDLGEAIGVEVSPVTAGTGISIAGSAVSSDLASGLVNVLNLGGNSSTVGELRLKNTAGTFYVGFKAPALSANKVWVLPTADGTSGQSLVTNGSGTLSWSDAGIIVGRSVSQSNAYTVCGVSVSTAAAPTSSAGTEILSVSHTPKNANNILEVEAIIQVYCAATESVMGWLLRDAGSASVHTKRVDTTATVARQNMVLKYTVTAGSTSATTFKVRMGSVSTNAAYMNGPAATVGDTIYSSITVKEFTV